MRRSPWAREYARRPNDYIWGTAPSGFAEEVSAFLRPGASVLDLGCGEGRDSVFFAAAGCDVTGVDLSLAALHKAERLARARGVRARWVQGDLAHVRLRPPFDLVYSCGSIHYVPRSDRVRLFARLAALTDPGGHHAHVVFTDRATYVERGEVIDYFAPGELANAYAAWVVLRHAETMIACDQDGTLHHHSAEEVVARRA